MKSYLFIFAAFLIFLTGCFDDAINTENTETTYYELDKINVQVDFLNTQSTEVINSKNVHGSFVSEVKVFLSYTEEDLSKISLDLGEKDSLILKQNNKTFTLRI